MFDTDFSNSSNIGIYIRESRDDNEENYETIETQRGLLIDYVNRNKLGKIHDIYIDDNVSGSGFERRGLELLKMDVERSCIDLLIMKDLSRLGRNNAKTLLFLDYLDEHRVRVLTFDGRFDSLKDNEMVGIETWVNERYIRDISRKIRASLKYKIKTGEYIGNAPYGYKKSLSEKNRLCIDDTAADVVKLIFDLYKKGNGYARITSLLNDKGFSAPGKGNIWNSTAVSRILCNRVYTGDTVQGVSEKVSFKSKKTRRLPESQWVVTENTHNAIIEKEEFDYIQRLRKGRHNRTVMFKKQCGSLSGLLVCGNCGSRLYARRSKNKQTFYVCGRYYKYGKEMCSSHYIKENFINDIVYKELMRIMKNSTVVEKLCKVLAKGNPDKDYEVRVQKIKQSLALKLKQQETLYIDRLEERISKDLFSKMNKQLEDRMTSLKCEEENLEYHAKSLYDTTTVISRIENQLLENGITCEMIRCMVNEIRVYDWGDILHGNNQNLKDIAELDKNGLVVIEFKMNKIYD